MSSRFNLRDLPAPAGIDEWLGEWTVEHPGKSMTLREAIDSYGKFNPRHPVNREGHQAIQQALDRLLTKTVKAGLTHYLGRTLKESSVAHWAREMIIDDPKRGASIAALREAYQAHALSHGQVPVPWSEVRNYLIDRGARPAKLERGTRGLSGVKLRLDTPSVVRWADEMIVNDAEGRASIAALRESYASYVIENGYPPAPWRDVRAYLVQEGAEPARLGGSTRGLSGLRLRGDLSEAGLRANLFRSSAFGEWAAARLVKAESAYLTPDALLRDYLTYQGLLGRFHDDIPNLVNATPFHRIVVDDLGLVPARVDDRTVYRGARLKPDTRG